MQVRVGMSNVVLTVNPGHSLQDAAKAMADRASARPWSSTPSSLVPAS